MNWPRRITLGSVAVMATVSAIEAFTAANCEREDAAIQEFNRPGSNRVLVFFPQLGADARTSSNYFLHIFEHDNVLLVDYPTSGYNRDAIFKSLIQKLEAYRGMELVIYAVSLGSGVALDFRRHLKNDPDLQEWFPQAKFIFFSLVTAVADINFRSKLITFVGFILRGGVVSDLIWRRFLDFRRLYPGGFKFRTEYGEAKFRELHELLSRITIRLLASELRAVHLGRNARFGEFGTDSALIFTYGVDDIVTTDAPGRLAEGFGAHKILQVLPAGHADLRMAIEEGGMGIEIQDYLSH